MEKVKTLEEAVASVSQAMIKNGKGPQLAEITQLLDRANKADTHILVCGEFKRGKSTFVNALIGHDVCPTDVEICTSAVSIIRYGATEKATCYYGDLAHMQSREIKLSEIEGCVVGHANDIGNTIYIDIELPSDFLKQGYVIIDTPGVGGLDPRHAALTKHFMPKADVALFITDVNEPLTESELQFLKAEVLPKAKRFAVVLNKKDLKDAESVDDFRDDTLNKIATYAQVDREKIRAVAVSAAAEICGDEYDLGDSNFGEVRALIDDMVNDYRREIRAYARDRFISLLDLCILPLNDSLIKLRNVDRTSVDSLEDEVKELEKQKRYISDPKSDFGKTVKRRLTLEREAVTNLVNELCCDLQGDKFPKLVTKAALHGDNAGQWLGESLNDELAAIGEEVSEALNNSFRKISQMPEFGDCLNFEIKDLEAHVSVRKVDTKMSLNRHITPMMSGLGIITFGSYLATGGLGVLAAMAMGAYVSYRNHNDAANAHSERILKECYNPQLNTAVSNIRNYVNTRFQEFNDEWLKAATERVTALEESIKIVVEKLEKAKADNRELAASRSRIQSQLQVYNIAKEAAKNAQI